MLDLAVAASGVPRDVIYPDISSWFTKLSFANKNDVYKCFNNPTRGKIFGLHGFAFKLIQSHIHPPFFSYDVMVAAISYTGWAIQILKNPSEELQLLAVGDHGRGFTFIKNPSKAVQSKAVENDGRLLEFISDQTDDMVMSAIKSYPESIKFANNQNEKNQLLAVSLDGLAIIAIRDTPSNNVQLTAVNQNPTAIKYIHNPCIEAILAGSPLT